MQFIQNAYAQTAASAPQESVLVSLLPLLIMAAVFYFLVIRPQIRREKGRQEMRSTLKKGDNVLTVGGVVAKITNLDADGYIVAQIANGVDVRLARSAVEGVVETSIPEGAKTAVVAKKAAPKKRKPTAKK